MHSLPNRIPLTQLVAAIPKPASFAENDWPENAGNQGFVQISIGADCNTASTRTPTADREIENVLLTDRSRFWGWKCVCLAEYGRT